MRVELLPLGLAALLGLSACSAIQTSGQDQPTISIELDAADPDKSEGTLQSKPTPVSFQVGYGRYGIACADTSFREGETPLGTFKVNAILSPDRFEMDPALIEQSGKSKKYLEENLQRQPAVGVVRGPLGIIDIGGVEVGSGGKWRDCE